MSVLTPAAPLPGPNPPSGRMSIAEFRVRYAGRRMELVRGVPQEMTLPTPEHGRVCGLICGWLFMWNLTRKAGHVLTNDSHVAVGEDTVRGPDVCFLSYRLAPPGRINVSELAVAPELIFEVESPSDLWTDLFAKVEEYLAAGTVAVVLIDPERRTASVCRPGPTQTDLTDADTLTVEDVLPGFAVPVAELFA